MPCQGSDYFPSSFKQQALIKPCIFESRLLPGKILAHSIELEPCPGLTILINAAGPLHGFDKLAHFIVYKHKPGFTICHSIMQSACCADQGDTTIAHGDHLRQTTGFVTRRHQKDICSSIDLPGKAGIIIRLQVDTIRKVFGKAVGRFLQLRISGPQQNGLPGDLIAKFSQPFDDQIDPLLWFHAGYQAK